MPSDVSVTDLAFLSISEIGDLLRIREVSCVELTETMLQRIERYDPRLNTFGLVLSDRALSHARALDEMLSSGTDLGPLHGIPIGLKDNIDTAGIPTTLGSKIMEQRIPTRDADVAWRLRARGAVLLGKNNLYEWAYGGVSTLWGPVRNPWNLDYEPGSSSSGSAAAVAAGFSFGAIGTDTGGSIRKPAAVCGVVGFAPTYDLVSRHGTWPVSSSLDRVGPLTRDADSAAIMLAAIAGPRFRAPSPSESVHGLRIGVAERQEDAPLSAESAEAVQGAAKVFASRGAFVTSVSLPSFETARKIMWVLSAVEAAEYHRPILRRHGAEYHPTVRQLLETAQFVPATDYVRCQRLRTRLCLDLRAVFSEVDAVLMPSVPSGPWRFDDQEIEIDGRTYEPRAVATTYHPLTNLSGYPCASVPAGLDARDLPLSFQLVARPFEDDIILRLAMAFEQATTDSRRSSMVPPTVASD